MQYFYESKSEYKNGNMQLIKICYSHFDIKCIKVVNTNTV
jgi:hypothetical protein